MDAGFILLERERRSFPQHHHAECVHPNFPERQCVVQYSHIAHIVVPDEFETLPAGQTNMLSAYGEL